MHKFFYHALDPVAADDLEDSRVNARERVQRFLEGVPREDFIFVVVNNQAFHRFSLEV